MTTGTATTRFYKDFTITAGKTSGLDYTCKTLTVENGTTEATAHAYTPEQFEKLEIITKEILEAAKNKTFYKIAGFLEGLAAFYKIDFTIGEI